MFDNEMRESLEKQIGKRTEKKNEGVRIARLFRDFDLRKSNRILNCGTHLEFSQGVTGGFHLAFANFCTARLCPMCDWQRSKDKFFDVFSVVSQDDFADKDFVFFTLTQKNCTSQELPITMKKMFSSLKLLTKKGRAFDAAFCGWLRVFEMTYNRRLNTYHPHFHFLAAVEKDYFKRENKSYISKFRLCEMWKSAMSLDYFPSVDIRKIYGGKDKGRSKTRAVAEVAKYTAKSADIRNSQVLRVFDAALKGRRLVGYGGLFKAVKARLDAEAEASKAAKKDLMVDTEIARVLLRWNFGLKTYSLVEVVTADAENKAAANE